MKHHARATSETASATAREDGQGMTTRTMMMRRRAAMMGMKTRPANAETSATVTSTTASSDTVARTSSATTTRRHRRSADTAQPQGERAKAIASSGASDPEATSSFEHWEMHLPFWPRKAVVLLDLALTIALGVLIGQILEVSGFSRWLAVLAWPLIRLGRLPKAAGPAFVVAFRSGSMAYSMLVSLRDQRQLNRRHLYTSVLVVSCIALLAHLPSFAVPLGIAFGWQATAALFGVRLAAILLEIAVVLVFSRWLARWWLKEAEPVVAPAPETSAGTTAPAQEKRRGGFWSAVWARSRRTLGRMLLFLVPTFLVMSLLEKYEFFEWLAAKMPGLFSFSFLPPQAIAIIPAQAVGLYNGAIAAANFVDAGKISVHQAILVILFGSMITAPVRTLKRALPTYLATLGAQAGAILAIAAQVLRVLFLLLCTYVLMMIWR